MDSVDLLGLHGIELDIFFFFFLLLSLSSFCLVLVWQGNEI